MLELEHGYPAVDVHTTLAPEDGRDRGWSVAPDRLERELRQAGIARSLVRPPQATASSYVAANNWVARVAVDRPLVAAARINGTRSPSGEPLDRLRRRVQGREDWHTTPDDVEQYAYDDRFAAFALAPASDGLPGPDVLASLEAVGRPLFIDGTGVPVERLRERLLDRSFPVVVGHFGGRTADHEQMAAAIEACASHDEWYLETSFVQDRTLLERALLEHPDRVLFGSGAPTAHPNVAVMAILTLDVSEDLLRRALWKNTARVLDVLDPRQTDY